MPGDDLILADDHKKKLDEIVVQMTNNKEPEENISAVVSDFKSKYGLKKKENTSLLSGSDSSGGESKSEVLDSGSPKFKFEGGKAPMAPVQGNENDLLRAAPSTAETTPKDISNYNPVTPEQREKNNPMEAGLARGLAQATSYLIKAPAGMYDMIALAGNKILDATPLKDVEIPSFKDLGNENGIYKSTVKDLDEAIQKSTQVKESARDGKKIQDYFSSGDYSKGFSLLGQDLMEMIPTSVALGFAVSQNPLMANIVGGSAFVADAKSKLDANPNLSKMPEQEKSMWAGLMGGTEMASENLGIPNLPIFKDILKNGGKEALEKAGKEFFDNTMGRVLKRYVGPGSQEVGTELLNNTLQNIYASASGDDPNRKPFDNSMDTFIHSAALTGALSAPTIVSDIRTKKYLARVSEIEKHKEVLGEQLSNPDVSDEVKPAISNRIQDLNEEAVNLQNEEKQNYNLLPDDKKIEVDNLLKKANDIATSATDPTISNDTREIFKKDIDNIDEKIDEIYKEAEKEREKAAKEKGLEKPEQKSAAEEAKVALTTEAVPAENAETPATETGLVSGEKKSEPIDITNLEKPKETTQESPESITSKTNEDATQKGIVEQNDQSEHQNGSKSGQATETGNRNSDVESGQVQQEVTTEKTPEPPQEAGVSNEPDIFGEKRKKKTVLRAEKNESYKDIVKNIEPDEKFYQSINVKKAHEHIDKVLNEFENNGHTEELANKIIEGKSPFHEKIKNMAAGKLVDRIRVMAEKDGNEFQKNILNKLAAKLSVARNKDVNVAATQTGLEAEVAKMLPLSEEGLKEHAAAALSSTQDTYLDEKQKAGIKEATQDINKLLESTEAQKAIKEAVESEINKIAEATKGKEWVNNVNDAIDSLKIDLSDC